MVEPTDDLQKFRTLNRRFQIATTLAIAGVVGMLIIYVMVAFRGLPTPTLFRLALSWSPAMFYLWALWTLRDFFSALARGDDSTRIDLAALLSRIGWALLLGGVTTVIVTPLIALLSSAPRPFGQFALLNVPPLTLGVVGLTLLAVAPMLRRARAFEQEAKKLKTVLEGFV
jgi:hypothetical protein